MRKLIPSLSSLFLPTTLALSMALVGCDKPEATTETTTEADGGSGIQAKQEATVAEVDSNTVTEAATVEKAELDTRELAEEQVFRYNNGVEPSSLDPQKVSGMYEFTIIRQMLEGLVSTDREGNTVPGMAESWDTPDNVVWTFKIRDANWSNGDPVTAEDMAYGLRRSLDPETASPYGSYLVDARILNSEKVNAGELPPEDLGVKAIDDKTLEVTLSEPVPYFVDMLVNMSTFPVHRPTVEKHGEKWTQPENIVVNGPYIITDWKVNEKITLERNPTYYDNDNTTIDKVELYAIQKPASTVARYKTGDLDIMGVSADFREQLLEEIPEEITESEGLCTGYMNYNTAKPPFDDAKVRRALALALDRKIIIDKVYKNGAPIAYQTTPPAVAGQKVKYPEWKDWSQEQRNEEAVKLLNEAGYNKENPLEFEFLYTTHEMNKKLAAATQSIFSSNVGFVNMSLANKEWKVFLDTTHQGDFNVAVYSWCGDYNEPSTFLNLYKTGNSNNQSQYSSAEYDAIMAKTLEEGVTKEQRAELYQKAHEILDKDMPFISIAHSKGLTAIKPYVMNWPANDPLGYWQAKHIAIAKH